MTIRRRLAAVPILVGFVAIAVFAATGSAAKPQSATLSVSFSAAPTTSVSTAYGTPYLVSGCGYDAANGGVTVVVHSPDATSFAGQVPDSNGCIAVSNFSTQSPGSYTVDAYQQLHNNKSSLMAETSFTVN